MRSRDTKNSEQHGECSVRGTGPKAPRNASSQLRAISQESLNSSSRVPWKSASGSCTGQHMTPIVRSWQRHSAGHLLAERDAGKTCPESCDIAPIRGVQPVPTPPPVQPEVVAVPHLWTCHPSISQICKAMTAPLHRVQDLDFV